MRGQSRGRREFMAEAAARRAAGVASLAHPCPPVDELREVFRYESETGKLFWAVRRMGTVRAEAGSVRDHGYIIVGYKGGRYAAHRLIWAMVHGVDPDGEIDHINGNRADNRIENLRIVSHHQNQMNMGDSRRNTSGFKGVSYSKSRGGYETRIGIGGGKQKWIGRFATAEEAARAYDAAVIAHRGEFARPNFPAKISPGFSPDLENG
jgi:hypothetical protein